MTEKAKQLGATNVYPCDSGIILKGLTKREYFAAKALQGILADSFVDFIPEACRRAVLAADQLLEELSKTNENE